MKHVSVVAKALLLAALCSPAQARVARPLGRSPRVQSRLAPPKLWVDRSRSFSLERPEGERWRFQAGAEGPDGATVPLLALSDETGAQLIVQSADGVQSLRTLARLLAQHLGEESRVHVEDIERVLSRGGEAYGFGFNVSDEARGRVAVVKAGDHVALVIASWPLGAPPSVVEDVEQMIASLGPVPGSPPPGAF